MTERMPPADSRDVDTASDEWPIAAAMLQFPGTLPDGSTVTDAPAELWADSLSRVAAAGFSEVEVPSAWLRLGDLSVRRLVDFSDVTQEAGLGIPGVSVVRESVIHPVNSAANLAFAHRTIDAAAALSVPVVCLGLHDALVSAQRDVLWFWTVAGEQRPTDPDSYQRAVDAFRDLGRHAASVGVSVSLELYEDTYLGTGQGSVRFLHDIDHDAVGLNPDVANLVRRQGPIESPQSILDATLPYANYWHVKNIARFEDPERGIVLTAPAPLESGFIDYRTALRTAARNGFHGALVVEHYGGDGLSVGASNRDYLRKVLATDRATP